MRIDRLVLENWMAFRGEHILTIPALPIAIVGRYAGNTRRSNWAGKTSLLEAIGWALYGTHRKRVEDGVIHTGAPSARVIVRLDMQQLGAVEVERTRPRGGPTKVRLTVIRPDGVCEPTVEGAVAEERIGRVLGMSDEELAATVVFAQGDTEALVGMRSGERRRLVAKWLELERWERAGEAARKRLKDTTTRLDVMQSLTPPTAAMTREQIAAEREALEQREADALELDLDADEARAALRGFDLEGATSAVEQCIADGRAVRAAITALGEPPPPDVVGTALREQDRAAAELGVAERRAREIGNIKARGFDGRCPVMEDACPAANLVGATVEQHAHLVDEARAKRDELVVLHRDAQAVVRRHTEDAQQRAVLGERLETIRNRYRTAKERADAMHARVASGEIDALRRRIDAGAAAAAELAEVRGRLRFLSHVDADITRREREDEERRAALAELVGSVKVLAAVTKALGPTGIPQSIAAQKLVVLEERANAMLQGTGLSFTFGWERETRDPAPVCFECGHVFKGKSMKPCPGCGAARGMKRSDELEILVDDGSGEVEDARMKSGGARVLVASAIRLAGGAMLRELKGSAVAWAIVDEPFGPLDAENRETLARTFAGMLGSVGLEQAFVVSHDAALLDALPARIVIERDGTASRAYVE